MRLRIRRNLHIEGADQELVEYLKALLTADNPDWVEANKFGRWTGGLPRFIQQFTEDEAGNLIIPRGQLDHLLYDLDRQWEVQDERVAPRPGKDWPEGQVILRPDDQEAAVQELMSYENGLLAAPAGSGKTVMGLEVARRLGLKTLWLTHRNELKLQTIGEIADLFEIPEKEVGIIHGPKCRIGEQITVGMIPTLNRRDLSALEEEFGTVIVDEAHHVPSSTFLRVVNCFAAKYIYGMTATAYRRDELESVMVNAIGPVVARIEHAELFEEEHLMVPTIRLRRTGWCPRGSEELDYHGFMKAMVQAQSRNALIVNDVLAECRPGNACIVLVSRTKHAEVLAAMLKERGARAEFCVASLDVDESRRPAKKKRKKRKKPAKFLVPSKVREQIVEDFKSGRLQVLVATYDLLKEGFNFRPLNRLFMATPIKWRGSVVQALGRIQRTAEGKTNAVAYDYVDEEIAMFALQAEARATRVYEKMEMPVEET